MAAFILIESRVSHPLIPLGFFRRRTPTGANIIGFGLGTMVFGMFFLLSLYMQEVLGFSALKTGVAYLAVALTAVVASGVAQALVTRLGVKPVLTIGMITLTIGLLLFAQIASAQQWPASSRATATATIVRRLPRPSSACQR
jgi:Na+/melibiose symporter-like transporter